jgi:transmembrane sensor
MSMEQSRLAANRQIIDEAAEWFVEINEGEPDPASRERFDAWLRLSPEHLRAYLRILPVWEEGALLDTQANGDPRALIAWARESGNVVSFNTPQSAALGEEKKSRKMPLPRMALAASIGFLCVAIALTAWTLTARRSTYVTGIGEQRLITLADGSRIELNARSQLRVRFSGRERAIDLLAGQALFHTAKDTARPFIVHSGDASVRAIGTQFDIYRKRSGTVVTVVEGRVAIQSSSLSSAVPQTMLSAGEQAIVTRSATRKSGRANIAIATAWTQQRLEFSRTPLIEVAAEFNRYNERQLVVKEGELQTFNVSGSFSSSDPLPLVRFLRAQPGIHVAESKSQILVSRDQ